MQGDPAIAEMTYEQARDELIAIVNQLETGTPSLEESLQLWERGDALAARCQQWLDGARTRLAQARADSGDDEGSSGARDAAESDAAERDAAPDAAPAAAERAAAPGAAPAAASDAAK
jgi:exodeoxyribonuclease VII small subunit